MIFYCLFSFIFHSRCWLPMHYTSEELSIPFTFQIISNPGPRSGARIRGPNPGPESGPQIRAPNLGPESGPRLRAPNPGPESGPRIRAPNPGPKSGPQIRAPDPGPEPGPDMHRISGCAVSLHLIPSVSANLVLVSSSYHFLPVPDDTCQYLPIQHKGFTSMQLNFS